MKRTERFVEADSLEAFPVPGAIGPGESLIGWYVNPSPWDRCYVVFTDKAIYSVEDGKWLRIGVDEMTGYEFPKSKDEVAGVRVRKKDGFLFVRVAGSRGPYGRYKDVFDFMMVVGKIAGDDGPKSPS